MNKTQWGASDNKQVGDVIESVPTTFPHLDAVGDVGEIGSKDGKRLAKFVTVRIYPDPETNEAFTKDIQIVKSYSQEVKENPGATCAAHGERLPCRVCSGLEIMNYSE
jgi:hypothetical protein